MRSPFSLMCRRMTRRSAKQKEKGGSSDKNEKTSNRDLLRGVSDSIHLPLQLTEDGLNKLPKEVAISCSGWLSSYLHCLDYFCSFQWFFGDLSFRCHDLFSKECKGLSCLDIFQSVFITFQELLSRVTRFAGASAGSLVSTLMVLSPDSLEDGLRQMYDVSWLLDFYNTVLLYLLDGRRASPTSTRSTFPWILLGRTVRNHRESIST